MHQRLATLLIFAEVLTTVDVEVELIKLTVFFGVGAALVVVLPLG